MDKTYKTEIFRTFLVEALPEPLTRSSSHLQIFDNYVAGTRMRLRSIRTPETNEWVNVLQQRFPIYDGEISPWKISEMRLDDAEHEKLQIFQGSEIRKNRYFHEFDSWMFSFDVYLGPLWGFNRARVDFETEVDQRRFSPPPFAAFEITDQRFFDDSNLVNSSLHEIRAELSRLVPAEASVAAPDQ